MSKLIASVFFEVLIAFACGAASMLIVTWLSLKAETRKIIDQATMACTEDETIICINATIIEDGSGRISWIDNNKKIMKS